MEIVSNARNWESIGDAAAACAPRTADRAWLGSGLRCIAAHDRRLARVVRVTFTEIESFAYAWVLSEHGAVTESLEFPQARNMVAGIWSHRLGAEPVAALAIEVWAVAQKTYVVHRLWGAGPDEAWAAAADRFDGLGSDWFREQLRLHLVENQRRRGAEEMATVAESVLKSLEAIRGRLQMAWPWVTSWDEPLLGKDWSEVCTAMFWILEHLAWKRRSRKRDVRSAGLCRAVAHVLPAAIEEVALAFLASATDRDTARRTGRVARVLAESAVSGRTEIAPADATRLAKVMSPLCCLDRSALECEIPHMLRAAPERVTRLIRFLNEMELWKPVHVADNGRQSGTGNLFGEWTLDRGAGDADSVSDDEYPEDY
jgi:hypothetical protein